MDLSSELCIAVIDDFKNLTNKIEELSHQISVVDANLPAWFQLPEELQFLHNQDCRENIATFLSQLEYLDEQNPKEIILGPGWISCSDTTLEIASQVNALKLRFKSSVIALKSHSNIKVVAEEFDDLLNKRPKELRCRLNKIGLSRLHLKQCYRQVPILECTPKRISWTWANTKAITKISKQKAIDMLSSKQQSSEINFQLQKLLSINDDETLAIVQVLAPHLRANLVLPSQDSEGDLYRKMIKGGMPILFPYEKDKAPKITPPKDKTGHNPERVTRKDVKLESEPFLPAIRAYRYKNKTTA